MSDQQAATAEATETQATTSAATENTEIVTPETVVPKNRFDEVAKRAYEAEKKLKAIETAQAKAKEAELTEQQKYAELYETEKTKAATLESRLADMQATMRKDKILRAVEAEASKAKFAEPADAFAFINLEEIEIDEAGNVKGAGKLVKDLAERKPYLLAQTAPTPGNGQSPRPAGKAGTAANNEQARQQALQAARMDF
jgi:hypothetical protein